METMPLQTEHRVLRCLVDREFRTRNPWIAIPVFEPINLKLPPMNKKTFTLALAFLVLTLVWLGTNIYWKFTHANCVHAFDFIVGILFVAPAAGMVYNEFHKKKRKHLDEVDKYKIP